MKKLCLTLLTFVMTFLSANAAIKVTPTILELNANDARGDYLTALSKPILKPPIPENKSRKVNCLFI